LPIFWHCGQLYKHHPSGPTRRPDPCTSPAPPPPRAAPPSPHGALDSRSAPTGASLHPPTSSGATCNCNHMLKEVYDVPASSAETIGAFDTGVENANRHRPAAGASAPDASRAAANVTTWCRMTLGGCGHPTNAAVHSASLSSSISAALNPSSGGIRSS